MNNYHNGDVTMDEAWDLAFYVDRKISSDKKLKIGQYREIVEQILSNPDYEIYDRNGVEVAMERLEPGFIADNERIEPSPSGI